MPLTKRANSSSLQSRRKITRRRTRRTTWQDLLKLHCPSTATNNSVTNVTTRLRPGDTIGATEQQLDLADTVPNAQRDHAENPDVHYGVELSAGSEDDGTQQVDIYNPSCPEEEMVMPLGALVGEGLMQQGDDESCNGDEDSGETPSQQDAAADAEVTQGFRKKMKFALSPSNLMALKLLCGSVKFSVQQYEVVRTIVKYADEETELPSYSTVQRRIFPHFLHNCFPRSVVKEFMTNESAELTSETNMDSGSGGHRVRRGVARVVYPSEWAKTDVSTLPHFNNIFPQRRNTPPEPTCDPLSIELSPIVRNRSAITQVTDELFVADKYGPTPARPGEDLIFDISSIPDGTAIAELREKNYVVKVKDDVISISGRIAATWCVGASQYGSASAGRARERTRHRLRCVIDHLSAVSQREADICVTRTLPRPRRGQCFFTATNSTVGDIKAGYICTLLQPQEEHTDSDIYFVIVSRFWKPVQGASSKIVHWVRFPRVVVPPSPNTEQHPFVVSVTQNMVGPPIRAAGAGVPPHPCEQVCRSTNSGYLRDWRPYVVYRILLYCDDFNESGVRHATKSAGRVYLLPIGMNLKARSARTAVHVISLTPPGVSTNEVLLDIIPDLVKASTEGIEGTTPSGERVVIFIDLVGFVGDYPAAAGALDVIGHTGDTPCTHCNMRKFRRSGASNLGFTTAVHSMNSASLRCGERHNVLRQANISDAHANLLGMKATEEVQDSTAPLLAIQRELDAFQHLIPLNRDNLQVIPGHFDAFRSNLIAPDHLLTGLARNALDLNFSLLPPPSRELADICICSALAENDLISERSVYNHNNRQLHSTSLSSLYCILLVGPPVLHKFMNKQDDIAVKALRLLESLQRLVSMTHWNPRINCDGKAEYELLQIEDGRPYLSTLQEMARDYVAHADEFWKTQPEEGCILDKPNLHRLLELYYHTIPAFGHVCHVLEIVFLDGTPTVKAFDLEEQPQESGDLRS